MIDSSRVLRYDDNPRVDLEMPVEIAEYYRVFEEPDVPDVLRESVARDGIISPLSIFTNGVKAVLRDGHHRLALARDTGMTTVPVQVIPNWLDRLYDTYRLPEVESVLRGWTEANPEFGHTGHETERTPCNLRLEQVVCSCGATWREAVV